MTFPHPLGEQAAVHDDIMLYANVWRRPVTKFPNFVRHSVPDLQQEFQQEYDLAFQAPPHGAFRLLPNRPPPRQYTLQDVLLRQLQALELIARRVGRISDAIARSAIQSGCDQLREACIHPARETATLRRAVGYQYFMNARRPDLVCDIFCLGGFNLQQVEDASRVVLGTCNAHVTVPAGRSHHDLIDLLNREDYGQWPGGVQLGCMTVALAILQFVDAGEISCCVGSPSHQVRCFTTIGEVRGHAAGIARADFS